MNRGRIPSRQKYGSGRSGFLTGGQTTGNDPPTIPLTVSASEHANTNSTAQIRTAIEVLKSGEHINHNAVNAVVESCRTPDSATSKLATRRKSG